MINTTDILKSIIHSTSDAYADGYDIEKIQITQVVYNAFKKENEKDVGIGNGDFNTLFGCPIEINNEIDSYMVVIKEMQ